jgi:pyrroline-5-carboxylate reductase
MYKIGFIGMGNMGYALLCGVKGVFGQENIIFHNNTQEKMERISKDENVKYVDSNQEVVKQSKYIIMAVKPQMFDTIFKEIKEYISKDNIIISLAPGVSIEKISKMCGTDKVVRTMPNTPAMVGEGMTGISLNKIYFDETEIKEISNIFNSVGEIEIVDEKIIDAVVCASGSSPAYVFMFIEALADSVVKCGMKREEAYKFVAQTVLGSAKLMLETKQHPGVLKDMVCSPGGTTIAGVEELENNGFRKAIFKATEACFDKCKGV